MCLFPCHYKTIYLNELTMCFTERWNTNHAKNQQPITICRPYNRWQRAQSYRKITNAPFIYISTTIFSLDHITSSYSDRTAEVWVQCVPDKQVHGANMGPTWVLSAPDGPHIGPMDLAIRGVPIRDYAEWAGCNLVTVFCSAVYMSVTFETQYIDAIWVSLGI